MVNDFAVSKVFALGSCRLMAPMKSLHSNGVIDLTNENYSWYAHNILEVKQRIAIMKNECIIPNELINLVVDIDSCKTELKQPIKNYSLPKVGIFEISTSSYRSYKGYQLHSMCISKLNFGGSSVELLQREQLEQEICNVASYFENVLLVCNIDKDESLIKLDKHRYELNLFLKLLANKYDHISVFDPNNFLNADNINLDLEDRNHFTQRFAHSLLCEYELALQKLQTKVC